MKILLVGESGLGKTTFVRNLFAAFARDASFPINDASAPNARRVRLRGGCERAGMAAAQGAGEGCRGLQGFRCDVTCWVAPATLCTMSQLPAAVL